MKTIFLCDSAYNFDRVYDGSIRARMQTLTDIENRCYTKADVLSCPARFAEVEIVFSTWGMPSFSEEEIKACLPCLKCLFYAAGSVQAFARPFLNCGVKVFSAWAANAVPVAEYTVSQIILANKAYGVTAVNYNRDVEVFPVLRSMLEHILGECPYKSPTDMGVNMVGNCIFDHEAVSAAAKQEIIRRYFRALCKNRKDGGAETEIEKIELIMRKLSCTPALDRRVVEVATKRAEETSAPAVAIELNDGRIVTGKTSPLLGASSAALLNALKAVAGIDKEEDIISPDILAPIQVLKTDHLGNHNPRLHTDEVLIALAITAVDSESADRAMKALPALKHAEVHSTVILSEVDASTFRKLGMQLSCEPQYQTKKLFHG